MTKEELREKIRQDVENGLSPKEYAIWETIEELSKERKLKVLDRILPNYNGAHICIVIKNVAWCEDFITGEQGSIGVSAVANKLIPELMLFKPEDRSITGAWFGPNTAYNSGIRRQVLKDLIELIKNSEATPEAERGQINNNNSNEKVF
ncbi:MAG: hypothetical protein LBK58_08745 [Prevotellaceae bacterium]|jgi:hypothetical protein|nr:hypothetical protein [Prevotellaceae bacterium]